MSKNNVEEIKENVQEAAEEVIAEVQDVVNDVVKDEKPKKEGFLSKAKKYVIPALCFVGGVAAKTLFDAVLGGDSSVALPGSSSVETPVSTGVQTPSI